MRNSRWFSLIFALTLVIPARALTYGPSAICAASLAAAVDAPAPSHLVRLLALARGGLHDAEPDLKDRVRAISNRPNYQNDQEFSFTHVLTGAEGIATYSTEVEDEAERASAYAVRSRAFKLLKPAFASGLSLPLAGLLFHQAVVISLWSAPPPGAMTAHVVSVAVAGTFLAVGFNNLADMFRVGFEPTYPDFDAAAEADPLRTVMTDHWGLLGKIWDEPVNVSSSWTNGAVEDTRKFTKLVPTREGKHAIKLISRRPWFNPPDPITLNFMFLRVFDPETRLVHVVVNIRGERRQSPTN